MKLHGRISTSHGGEPFVARLTRNRHLPQVARGRAALLLAPGEVLDQSPEGFRAVVRVEREGEAIPQDPAVLAVGLPEDLGYLGEGDIVRVAPGAAHVRVLYRRASRFNSMLVTERCNSNCLMCSQPPKEGDDSYLVRELLDAVPLMAPDTPELGITGGEPTLLGADLHRLIAACRDYLPRTALHMLSNGRRFAFRAEAERIAALRHHDFMIGIPLYSDLPAEHDFVVQAEGAFDETVRGLLNLARYGVGVELRVVIHQQTYRRLPQLGAFIARNLPFVHHVALMGLEMMGYVKMNLEALWVDPLDYQDELLACVETLLVGRVKPAIFNHQLCVLDRRLWPFAVRSISDWKNVYMPECEGCGVKEQCGGFFSSANLRYTRGIRPQPSPTPEATT